MLPSGAAYPTEVDSFWTSGQRQAHSLHEVSYRACFKPQLPEFFIGRYSAPGDKVLDPFMGRGTSAIQAMLMGRVAYGSDINPLCAMLTEPRLCPPSLAAVQRHFLQIPNQSQIGPEDEELLVFYHPKTLRHLLSLRDWFAAREAAGDMTAEDKWIRMVALNRLAGHSPGFLSVKTMPPNQAVSLASQRRINERHGRMPEEKDVLAVVMKKSRSLLRDWAPPSLPGLALAEAPGAARAHRIRCASASRLDYIKDGEMQLAVTSPPFLNVVDYAADNWLRCWFAGIDAGGIAFDGHARIPDWTAFIQDSFEELARVIKPGGHVAFEVGEVRNGSVRLEENVVEAMAQLPFRVEKLFINAHEFTKTANCWGIDNNTAGTNTNRIVLAQRT